MSVRRPQPAVASRRTEPATASAAVGVGDASLSPAVSGHDRRFWLIAYAAAFLVVEGLLLFMFLVLGRGSRLRAQMEAEADGLLAAGKGAEAVAVAEDIGRRWPDQRGTFAYERRLGRALEASGEHGDAAIHLLRAVDAAPKAWDVRAEAGEAFLRARNEEKAVELFRAELAQGNPDSDLARVHMALIALEGGNVVQAFKSFQSVAKREALPQEAVAAIARAEADIAGPARAEARRRLDQDHPLPPSSGS